MTKAEEQAAANDGDGGTARTQLLDAASAIMREGDTIDLSLSELSLRAGLNSALVKYYFGNKAGLMLALLERDMENILGGLEALIAKDMSPEVKLRRHIAAVVDTYYRYPYLNRLLMRMVRDQPPKEARQIAERHLRPISEAYEKLLRRGIEEGVFRDIDPQNFYFTLTGAADRFFSARLVLRHCYDQDDLSDRMRDEYSAHMIDFVMAALLKK